MRTDWIFGKMSRFWRNDKRENTLILLHDVRRSRKHGSGNLFSVPCFLKVFMCRRELEINVSRNRECKRLVPSGDAKVVCAAVPEKDIQAEMSLICETEKEVNQRQKRTVSEYLGHVCLSRELVDQCSQLDSASAQSGCPTKGNCGVVLVSSISFSGFQLDLFIYSTLRIECGDLVSSRKS